MSEPARPAFALVGAGRRRQGLGPFVARDLIRAGAGIAGFVVTSAASAAEVAAALARDLGCQARGYFELASLLRSERVDAVAILSPAETHAAHLATALAAGLPVLCEKPFVWGAPRLGDAARGLVAGFASRGLLLWENCQLVYALPAFERLHPGALAQPPRRLAMLLEPASRGVQMLGDSAPHALALAQALLPADARRLTSLRFSAAGADADAIDVAFTLAAQDRTLDVALALRRSLRLPRSLAIEIDGRRARRLVSGDRYELSFAADDGRSVPLPDPLTLLVADFVRALASHGAASPGDPAAARRGREIVERMELLEQIVAGFARHARGESGA